MRMTFNNGAQQIFRILVEQINSSGKIISIRSPAGIDKYAAITLKSDFMEFLGPSMIRESLRKSCRDYFNPPQDMILSLMSCIFI